MTVETLSETLFKQHCDAREVQYRRIEEGTTPVADFEVRLASSGVIVEVKQLNPNKHDVARQAAMRNGKVGHGHAPTGRLRNLLGDAYRQIKTYASCGLPAIVVCYNHAGALNHIDNFSVTRAMFGGMAAYIALGKDGRIHPTGQGFTGQRKVTRNSCRGLSAVCVLSTPTTDTTRLVAYHNPYVTNPVAPKALHRFADSQFGYKDPHVGRNVQLLAEQIEI